jgi:hypothetical protein
MFFVLNGTENINFFNHHCRIVIKMYISNIIFIYHNLYLKFCRTLCYSVNKTNN